MARPKPHGHAARTLQAMPVNLCCSALGLQARPTHEEDYFSEKAKQPITLSRPIV